MLGIETAPSAEDVQQVRPATGGERPYCWQVCEPHDAFKNPATVDESLFAATLGGVFSGSARPEYLDPRIFFSHTYFTENLRQTINDVASRMNGGPGPSVTEMQTPFGGGKTHALLTLYQRAIAGSDGDGVAPGNALFRRVLEAASPGLILIDELVSYLVKLKFSNARRTQNLYRQTLQFMQEMLQEAGNVPGVCVLISLPKSKREWGGLDPAQIQLELAVVEDLQARTDRVVSKRTPVNDDEIYTLMSKRLFKKTDPDVAARVARTWAPNMSPI